MENRRPANLNTEKPFNRERFQKRPNDRNFGEKKYQPRDDNFRSKDNNNQTRGEGRFQSRDNRDNRSQGQDNRFQSRDNRDTRSQSQDNRSQSRDNRFQSRDNKFQSRDNRFQSRDNRFQNRDNKFQSRDNKFQSRDNKFDSKKRVPTKGTAPAWKEEVKPKVYSEMQITDGKHRGKFFESTTSPKVRPTTRKIREIMFRLISRRVRGRRFLDLCAGSGAVGIDAISRGALLGTFVERSAKMCSFIRKNMAAMEIKEGHGEIFESELVPFLKQMAKRRRFWDVVFLDPPYDANYDEFLEYFSRGTCIKLRGLLIIEHHAEMFFPENLGVLKRWRVIIEGETALSFYERK